MRPRAEWLILPLFALPLLLGVGGHLWASMVHERDLDAYRLRAADQIARITADREVATRLADRWERASATISGKRVAVAHFGALRVRGPLYGLAGGRWNFAEAFPSGLPAPALAHAGTRLKIEAGDAPLSLAEIDEPTRALHGLLREPDALGLRTVMLPPATKRYIVKHWLKTGDEPWMHAALNFIDSVESLWRASQAGLVPGYHMVNRQPVAVPRGSGVLQMGLVFRNVWFVAADRRRPSVRLWFSPLGFRAGFPHAPAERRLWEGRLRAPLAGTWSFTDQRGPHWWQSARFESWLAPGIAVLLLLLAIPTALWFALRRRRKLDEARSRFINELAHDLRTPLTSLRLHAEMLGSGRTPDARRGHYLALIERESSRLTSLLTNLLDLSRLDGARTALHPESIRLAGAVEQATQAFVAVHPDRAEDVTCSGPTDLTVRADAAALARVLGNLLENAGKFTEAGTAIRIHWASHPDGVTLTVSDDGPGIPEKERRKVFDRYSRGASAQAAGVAGSGLGLALVQELTRRMDGSVRLQPSAQGATFVIQLPKGSDA